ncbi:MAG: hypothetical protein IJW59_04995 [Clostridia bacterium]|nr:hypothetical protein [Clostridia bacterium]
MKIKNVIMTFFLILISVVCCVGCADIEVSRMIDANETIIDTLIVTLDKSKIDKSGRVTYVQVENAIHNDMKVFEQYVKDWKESFKDKYPNVYSMVKDGILVSVYPEPSKQLSVSIEFAGLNMFGLFYGMVEDEDIEYQKAMTDVGPFVAQMINQEYSTEEFGLFLYKYSMIKDVGVLSHIKDFEVDGIGKNYYSEYCNMTGFSEEDIDVCQIFAYPDDRIYSNADTQEVVQNMTFLAWDLSEKEDGFQMSIYKIAPRTTMWYVVALIISAIVVVVIFVIFRKKYSKVVRLEITKQEVEKDEK